MSAQTRPRSVAVLGGGVIGLACAYYLSRAGLEVTVVERDRVGSGASRGNAGEICPDLVEPLPAPGVIGSALRTLHQPEAPLYLRPRPSLDLSRFLLGFVRHANRRDHRAGAAALARLASGTIGLFEGLEAVGVDTEANKNGFLYVFSSQEAAARGRRAAEALGAPVAGSGVLDQNALRHQEPCLGSGAVAGFAVDSQWSINPGRFVESLAAQLRSLGVEIVEGARVTRVTESQRGTSTHTTAGTFETDRAVIAAGVWTRQITRSMGVDLNILAGKGYSFTVPAEVAPSRLVHLGDAHVAVNPLRGGLRIAGTMELDADCDRFDLRRIAGIVAAARPYVCGVDWHGRREEWVGPRPMTPDGLPAIGELPGHRSVFVATGHNMLGLMLAPATGRLITELLTAGSTDATAFNPRRIARRRGPLPGEGSCT